MKRAGFIGKGFISGLLFFYVSAFAWGASSEVLPVKILRSQAERAWTSDISLEVRYFVKNTDPSGFFWCQVYFETLEVKPSFQTESEIVFEIPLKVSKGLTCSLPLKIADFIFTGKIGAKKAQIQLIGADQMWADAMSSASVVPFASSQETVKFETQTHRGASFSMGRFLIGFKPLERFPEGLEISIN